MSKNDNRILLHITMLSGNNPIATIKADSTYYRLNNTLNGNEQLPNITAICNYCDGVNKQLGAYIRNKCLDLKKEDAVFEPYVTRTNSILNVVERSMQKNIRIMLYPGERDDINDLNMSDATHNMIVQFNEDSPGFSATEPHKKFPSFYQYCASEDEAMLYFEALLVDACICHYLGISDVAFHHDDKQQISYEKVQFIRELSKIENLEFLSSGAQKLVRFVGTHLNDATPYISFFSIFTIAPINVFPENPQNCLSYFEDYCNLWDKFQKWYFHRHGRLFSRHQNIENPLDSVFNRNKYKGQISPEKIKQELEKTLKKPVCETYNPPFGLESRYAVIILVHKPKEAFEIEQCNALFSGQIHPVIWDIIYWGDIRKYDDILHLLEVVPFLIIE